MNQTDSPSPFWGNNVRALMEIHKKTVADVAQELDVSDQAIYDILNRGVKHLSAKRAAQLQAVFGTPYYKIFPLIEE